MKWLRLLGIVLTHAGDAKGSLGKFWDRVTEAAEETLFQSLTEKGAYRPAGDQPTGSVPVEGGPPGAVRQPSTRR